MARPVSLPERIRRSYGTTGEALFARFCEKLRRYDPDLYVGENLRVVLGGSDDSDDDSDDDWDVHRRTVRRLATESSDGYGWRLVLAGRYVRFVAISHDPDLDAWAVNRFPLYPMFAPRPIARPVSEPVSERRHFTVEQPDGHVCIAALVLS